MQSKSDDIATVLNLNRLKIQYKIVRLIEVYPSGDCKVRKEALAFKNFNAGNKLVNMVKVKILLLSIVLIG